MITTYHDFLLLDLKPDNMLRNLHLNDAFMFSFSCVITILIITAGLIASTSITGFYQYNILHPVNKETCTCDCWDGFYRGIYPRKSGNTFYKAFYFNFDTHFIYILFIFLFYAELLRKFVEKVFYLFSCNLKNIDWLVFINLLFSIYGHYYGAWCLINYLNDRDYRMINSQLFFAATELIPSVIYFKRLVVKINAENFEQYSSSNKPSMVEYYLIFFISTLHIVLALGEKILWGVITLDFDGSRRHLVRDFNLIIGDLLGLVVFLKYFYFDVKNKEIYLKKNHSYFLFIGFVISFCCYVFYKKFCAF
jgi:hypothetical protein